MNVNWDCSVCKHKERTSPCVQSLIHVHGGTEYPLTPHKKQRQQKEPLKDNLWSLFSEYVRRKYADDNGYVECVTCGRKLLWKEVDAGHFIHHKKATFFDLRNVHPQCRPCNGFKAGNAIAYKEFMIKRYGQDVVYALEYLSNRRYEFKDYWLKAQITFYKQKLSELKNAKP